MKRIASIVLLATLFSFAGYSQDNYWQQEVKYTINVSLNDKSHSLKGNLDLEYINNSPDTLAFIWFHIWPNAYKNDSTALAKQLKADGEESKKVQTEKGFIDSLNFTIGGKKVVIEKHPEHIDVIKVVLPQPLLPGQKTSLSTPFYVKFPNYFSRSGHDGQQYMACQWYPKPAVYDKKGWHAFPYLDQGEFYSEYASFKVNISLPAEYVVGATGKLQTADEYEKYKQIGSQNYRNRKDGNMQAYKAGNAKSVKTLSYIADSVLDFAWFADKDFVIQYDTLQLASGKIIDAFSFYQPAPETEWRNSIEFIEDAARYYSSWLGEYPYPTVQAVEGPKNNSSGGMEYPMITLITSPDAERETLDAVITHEVGHNWFMGIFGTNERDNPWMDEGINSYYQFRYEAIKYRGNSLFGKDVPKEMKKLSADAFLERVFGALNSIPAKEPIATSSTGFSNKEEYGLVVYVKTAVWFYILETTLGREALDKAMQEYFNTWKFKHPYPEDLQAVLERSTGKDLDKLFELLNKEGNF